MTITRQTKKALVAFFAFILFFVPPTLAQRWELGGGVGGMLYKGDLAPYFNPRFTRPALQGILRYNVSYSTVLRANITYGHITAKGAVSPNLYIAKVEPNSFKTVILEVCPMFEYNFFDFRSPKFIHERGTPYFAAGLGFYYFQPGTYESRQTSPVQAVIPFGIGYKYRLNKNLNLGVEFLARKTFTDLLDDVKTYNKRTNNQRGFKYDKDWYMMLGFNLTYTIYTIECPFDYNK